MVRYKEKSAKRSGTTVKIFDAVACHFCPTLSGAALFAVRVVKALVRSPGYGLRAFPSGSIGKIASVTCRNINES